jgi:hypothetical protein
MLLALGLAGTSLLLAAAACLPALLVVLAPTVLGLLFLQGLLLGLRTWKLSRLLRSIVLRLFGWLLLLLRAVGLLGSRQLSVWLLAGQLTCTGFAGEPHLARRLAGMGAACAFESSAADAEGSADAAASFEGRASLLSLGVQLLHVLAMASFGVAVLLAGIWPAAAVPGAAGILEIHAAVLENTVDFFEVTSLPSALSLLLSEAFGLCCLLRCCCRLFVTQAVVLFCSSDRASDS